MKLSGHQLKDSADIAKLITELAEKAKSYHSQVDNVRPVQPAHVGRLNNLVDQVHSGRGRPLFYPYVGTGAGQGVYVELEDGSIKMDLINGIGIHILGHGDERVMAASLRGALSDIVMQGNLQPNLEYIEFTNKMVELASRGSRLRHAWLATCGTMANENALKICRQKVTPARKIVAMSNAFAGRSTMMAEVTDNPAFKEGLPEYHEVLRLPFYDKRDPQSAQRALEKLRSYIEQNPKDICCFTFEPMQGEGGYKVAPREYFLPLLELCQKTKIPVWADEVQTFCRTGQFFAYEKLGIGEFIDVCTVAKTAQNGVTLYTEEFNPKPGLIAGTFSGSSVSLAAGLEVLKILDEGSFMGAGGHIEKIHQNFIAMLNRLNESGPTKGLLQDAEGLGLMVAVTPFDGSKEKQLELLKKLFANGLMAFGCGRDPYRLRFLLPAVTTEQDIERAGRILEQSVKELT